MAGIEVLNLRNSKEHDFSIRNKSTTKRNTFKRKTYPLINPPVLFRKSKSVLKLATSKPSRENIQIALSDFWSGRMKAEVRYLEKRNSMISSNNLRKPKTGLKKLPEISMKTKKAIFNENSPKYLNSQTDMIPAIQKLIDDCDDLQKNSRRLSGELLTADKILRIKL